MQKEEIGKCEMAPSYLVDGFVDAMKKKLSEDGSTSNEVSAFVVQELPWESFREVKCHMKNGDVYSAIQGPFGLATFVKVKQEVK